MKTVQVMGCDGNLAYEVDLADNRDHKVYVMIKRKPAGYGYSWNANDHYRRQIKETAAIGKRMIRLAADANGSKVFLEHYNFKNK